MLSRIVTAPDHIPDKGNILLLNAHTEHLTTLVLWLKTIRDQYTIHIWHEGMPDSLGWAQQVAYQADIILAHNGDNLPEQLLSACGDKIIWFGNGTENYDLIHYFLKLQEATV